MLRGALLRGALLRGALLRGAFLRFASGGVVPVVVRRSPAALRPARRSA
ncbi:hypothetical protein ACQFX6_24980 [Streptomyces sp. DSM 41987]